MYSGIATFPGPDLPALHSTIYPATTLPNQGQSVGAPGA